MSNVSRGRQVSNVSRRKFIAGVAATVAGAGVCVYGLRGCATFSKVGNTPAISGGAYIVENDKVRIDLAKVAELGRVGGSVKIIDSKLPQSIIVARSGDTEFVAVSLQCPHRGVEVEYRHAKKQFRCASLGHSTFGMDGARKKGFANTSLRKFEAQIDPLETNNLIISPSNMR